VGFYAPLKAPGHPVPSGDRAMARGLVAALGAAGHRVTLLSELRAFLGDPGDTAGLAALRAAAEAECARIALGWRAGGAPDALLCYHPYYKAPDLVARPLAAAFGLPYLTAETSYSARRNLGIWAAMQAEVLAGARGAAVNLCLTARDARGLAEADPAIRTARLYPFVEIGPLPPPAPEPGHLVTVAMMRPGDKFESFRALAAALALVPGDWRLSVAGDGAARAEVEALFAPLAGRVSFLGLLDAAGVAALLARGWAHVWPGVGEAFGLAYLEAQAAGLPVAAWATAGVPEVVGEGESGLLAPAGDVPALTAAVARLLADAGLRESLSQGARARVAARHGLAAAAATLDTALRAAVGGG
jgi:glycosyltransferase involved in cell wall biosynthesis